MTSVALPHTLDEAVARVAANPDATVIAGGTDVMPAIGSGRLRPSALICLSSVADLRGAWPSEREIVLGAGLTFADLMSRQVSVLVPALAQAARTVGTPQVRAQATLGGNLVSSAPDGDVQPVLAALGAEVVCRGPSGWRQVPILELYERDGTVRLGAGELVVSVRVPVSGGTQGFLKIGLRSGGGRTAVSLTLVVDPERRTVCCTLGNLGPVVRRIDHAGHWLAEQVDWDQGAIADTRTYETFATLVGDGVMASEGLAEQVAARSAWWVNPTYLRRAVEVCARRALLRALPPSGWLRQVREYQQQAEFQRYVHAAFGGPNPPLPEAVAAASAPVAVEAVS